MPHAAHRRPQTRRTARVGLPVRMVRRVPILGGQRGHTEQEAREMTHDPRPHLPRPVAKSGRIVCANCGEIIIGAVSNYAGALYGGIHKQHAERIRSRRIRPVVTDATI